MAACKYAVCDAPLAACNLGEPDYRHCKHWAGEASKERRGSNARAEYRLPWHGNAMGHLDIETVAARSSPRLIGIVGPHDAGKTTLLTVFYLLLSRGDRLQRGSFAGSFSLGGWENLAHALRWHPDQPPSFPPHTSRTPGRTPGLLHLTLRLAGGFSEDLLFTDAPGEWFEVWSTDRTSAAAEGARWVAQHGSAFALIADSGALAGPDRGEAKRRLMALARRLADNLESRRIAVVWSKSDITVPESIRISLQENFRALLPDHREFNLSIYPHGGLEATDWPGFVALFDWLLEALPQSAAAALPKVIRITDPFLALREA